MVGGNYVQFTTEVWQSKSQTSTTEEDNGHIPEEIKEKVKIIDIEDDELPFLDMKIAWEAKELSFSVYQKKD
eukprot:7078620-Ditylum_brightwellii.AAC.1